MAQPSPLAKAVQATAGLPFVITRVLQQAAYDPLITGSLLYVLTRGPEHLRQRVLAPFRSNVLATNGPERVAKAVQVLKVLLALGAWKRANQMLNSLAMNGWYLPGTKPMAKWQWDGRTEVVVITGGCSGFGYEMVKGFSGKAKVMVLDVSDLPEELSKLPEVHYFRCDMTDFDAITSTAAEIKSRFGNPTVLINNAGIGGDPNMNRHSHTRSDGSLIGSGKTVLDTSTPFLESIMKVNLSSHFVLIKEFLPGMLDAKKGHIVGIASMASFVAAPGLLDYCITKVGVLYLMEGLRNELLSRYKNGFCVATTSVHPSWHKTGIIKGFEDRLAEYGIVADPASNVANAVVEQVLSHRSGRIFMPRSAERQSGTRNLPIWVQDWFLGNVSFNPFASSKKFTFD